jgi:hypothetical protein
MTNKILLFLISCSFIGIIMACLATVPSFGAIAHVEIPSDEIEITFEPFQQAPQPIVNITVPHSEVEIFFLSDK